MSKNAKLTILQINDTQLVKRCLGVNAELTHRWTARCGLPCRRKQCSRRPQWNRRPLPCGGLPARKRIWRAALAPCVCEWASCDRRDRSEERRVGEEGRS